MDDSLLLTILKMDLQISSDKLDIYLETLLSSAASMIEREGITLETSESQEDGMLVVMYAAYLYRKRREVNVAMPRMLRYALNNRLFSQKAGGANG